MTRRRREAGFVLTSPPPRRPSHHRISHAVCSDRASQHAHQGVSATSNWEPGNRIAFVYMSCTCTALINPQLQPAPGCGTSTSVYNQWRADRDIVVVMIIALIFAPEPTCTKARRSIAITHLRALQSFLLYLCARRDGKVRKVSSSGSDQ